MPVILSDAIRRIRSLIDEPTVQFWTDTELTDWVNDGSRDLARKAEDLLNYDTSLAITAGSYIYALPTGLTRIFRAEFVPTGSTQTYPVQPASKFEMDQIWGTNQQIQSTSPSYFVTLGYPGGTGNALFRVQLFPVPAQGGKLNLYYYGLPYRFLDPIANPGELDKALTLPEGWDDLVIMYAEACALRKNRDDRWKDVLQLYEQKVQDMLDITRFYYEGAQQITTGSRVGVPDWLYGFGE